MPPEEAETPQEASSPSTAAPADSATAQDNTPAAQSTAGAKEPESLSEALEQTVLEEPKEAEVSPTEAPSGKPTEPEAKQDEPAKVEEKPTDAQDAPFHTRKEWTELSKVVKDPAQLKAARSILRPMLERETHLTRQVETLKPAGEMVQRLKTFTGDETGFNNAVGLIETFATDPANALPLLRQLVADAENRSGAVISSEDLKAAEAEIDKNVQDGLMDPETGTKNKKILLEAERARAQAKHSEGKLKADQAARRRQAQDQAQNAEIEAFDAWESSIKAKDPDYGTITPEGKRKVLMEADAYTPTVADRVFDAMCFSRMKNPNCTTEEVIKAGQRAYKLAKGESVTPALRQQRVLTAQGSSVTAKPRPKTLREAMDQVQLQ